MEMKQYIGVGILGFLWLAVVSVTYFENISFQEFPKIRILPKFRFEQNETQSNSSEEDHYIIEKLYQKQKNEDDMRSGLYLTHHRYLLENIVTKSVNVFDRKFSLNDICFKPHANLIRSDHIKSRPNTFERLELESRRLSPCLITTPLNCFYDSFMLHTKISRWKYEIDYLNRRLRNSYLENIENDTIKPYVKADDGIQLINKWSELITNSAETRIGKEASNNWLETVKQWISSIKPTSKICADPLRSCDDYLEAENYFNMCTAMNTFNEYELKMNTKLTFNESGNKILTKLDCVEDRETFIEWARQRELESILKVIVPNMTLNVPSYSKMMSKGCPGLFQKNLPIFNRNFEKFGKRINSEIYLLTPKRLMESLNEKAKVNKVDKRWNIKETNKILKEWRLMIRDEVKKFNQLEGSQKIGVISQIKYDSSIDFKSDEEHLKHFIKNVQLFLAFFIALLTIFLIFVWIPCRLYSIFMFFGRLLLSFTCFLIFYSDENGFIVVQNNMMFDFIVLLLVNIVLTSKISNLKSSTNEINSCGKNKKKEGSESNLSWMSRGVESIEANRWTLSRIWIVLDLYVKKQTFKKLQKQKSVTKPTLNENIWVFLFILAGFYQFYGNNQLIRILVLLTPILLWYYIEKNGILYRLQKKMERVKNRHERIVGMATIARELIVEQALCDQEGQNIEMSEMGNRRNEENIQRETEISQCGKSIERLQMIDQLIKEKEMCMKGCSERISESIKLCIISVFFRVLTFQKKVAIGSLFLTGCLILISIGILCTSKKIMPSKNNYDKNELWIDVELKNYTLHWHERKQNLNKLFENIDLINGLEVLTNWPKISQEFSKSNNLTFEQDVIQWYLKDTIVANMVAPWLKPSWIFKEWRLRRFKFRIRCEMKYNEQEIIQKKLDKVLNSLSHKVEVMQVSIRNKSNLEKKLKPSLSYEFVTSIIFGFLIFIKFNFFSTANSFQASIATIFVLSVKIETSALGWMASLNIQDLTNIGIVIGILCVWTPFLEVASYKKKRSRFKFNELISTIQILGGFLIATLIVLVVSIGINSNNSITIVLFLVLMFIGMINTMAITTLTVQLYDQKRKSGLFKELNGSTTIRKVRSLFVTHDHRIDIELQSLPRSLSVSSAEDDDDDDDEVEEENRFPNMKNKRTIYEKDEYISPDNEEDDEDDINVVEALGELQNRWENPDEEADRIEREEFLKNVRDSNVGLRNLVGHHFTRQQRQNKFLELLRKFDDDDESQNQPSTSAAHFEESETPSKTENEEPHPLAKYFPPHFTRDMIDFVTDPANRDGKPWEPPVLSCDEQNGESKVVQEPTIEEDDARARRRIREMIDRQRAEARQRRRRQEYAEEQSGPSEDEGIDSDEFDDNNPQ